MTRKLFVLILLAATLPAHAAENGWSSLWRNADQRGELLLQQGDAAAAAKVYTDPRRKAHARLIAGDYAQAARDLAAFDDGDAHYNRGNALAHTGDLQGALGAYDAALQRDPNNRDALHNRDLVARALKQNPPPPPQGASGKASKEGPSAGQNENRQASSSSGRDSDGARGSREEREEQGNAAGPGKNGKSERDGQTSASNDPAPEKETRKQAEAAHEKTAKGAPGATASEPGKPQQNIGTGTGSAASPEQDSVAQARRDAAASLSDAVPLTRNGASAGDGIGDGAIQQAAPFNEQKLAQEQWLRSIPDDPGGLLRRKFLIEHLMRQQKAPQ